MVEVRFLTKQWVTALSFLFVFAFLPVFAMPENIALSLTEEEKTWLSQNPEIILAPDPDFQPIEFFDEDGRYKGIAADYISLLESRLGIRFRIVHLDSWAQVLDQVRARQVDLLGAIVETPQRNEYLLFTEPYLEFPGVIVAQKGVSGALSLGKLRGMKVAIVQGYTGHELILQHYPEINVDVVPDTSTGLRKVSFGMVDAFVGNLGTASFSLEKEGITNLRIAGETGYVYGWSLATRKDLPVLHSILQKAAATVSDDELKTIIHKWVRLEPPPAFATKEFWLTVLGFTVIALFALAWVSIWNRLLKRRVTLRTEELKKALAEEEAARDNVDTILKSVADGLIVANMENRVVLMNRAAEKLLNTSLEDAVSQPIDTVLTSPDFCRYVSRVRHQGASGGSVEWEIEGEDPKASRVLQARTALVHSRSGETTGTITIVRDVTREREVDKMKNEFISTAAHELRTPLTTVMGYTELLLKPKEFGLTDPEAQKELLEIIYEKATRLESIISDLLDLGRVQSGRLISLNKDLFDINRLIAKVVEQQAHRANDHQFEVSNIQNAVMVYADEQKLEQVMDNLLSNAIKFSPKGKTVWVNGQVEDDRYVISVKDEGIGMSVEQVEKVFDKFYRVDSSDTAKGGLGLGMSIVQNIIKAHGGEIQVESGLGVGTRVQFAIPLEKV